MDGQDTHQEQRRSEARPKTDGILPLAVRQRLWDQLWTRLLAPPVDPADKVPASKHRDQREGGPR